MKLEIEKTLVLSTGHISEEERDFLENGAPGLVCNILPYGFLVRTEEYDEVEENANLLKLLAFAKGAGCDWLRLDCDGPHIEGFAQFDW